MKIIKLLNNDQKTIRFVKAERVSNTCVDAEYELNGSWFICHWGYDEDLEEYCLENGSHCAIARAHELRDIVIDEINAGEDSELYLYIRDKFNASDAAEFDVFDAEECSYEYDEFLVGYIVTATDGRSVNLQFEKCNSNHPEPNYYLYYGCTGDTSYEVFKEHELKAIDSWLQEQPEIIEMQNAVTYLTYETSFFEKDAYPLDKWAILDAYEEAKEKEEKWVY